MSTTQIFSGIAVVLGISGVFMLSHNAATPKAEIATPGKSKEESFHCFKAESFCITLPETFSPFDGAADPVEGISLKSPDGSIQLKIKEYQRSTEELRYLFDAKYQTIQSATKVYYVGKVFLTEDVNQLSAEFALNNIYYYYLTKDLGNSVVEILVFGADKGREAVLKAAMGINVSRKMASAHI